MSNTNHDRPTTAGELVPVKFSRFTRRGVLLGLSLIQLVTLAVGGSTLIGAFYAGGGILLAYTAPVWVLASPPKQRRHPRARLPRSLQKTHI